MTDLLMRKSEQWNLLLLKASSNKTYIVNEKVLEKNLL